MTRGFTLLELCVTLAVVGILLCVAIPSWRHFIAVQYYQSQRDTLLLAIQTARYESIRRRSIITLCPSEDGSHCGKMWSTGQLLFVVRNAHVVNPEKVILYFFKSANHRNILRWHGFLSDDAIQFFPGGYNDNGKFLYEDLKSSIHFEMVLNRVGRVHMLD